MHLPHPGAPEVATSPAQLCAGPAFVSLLLRDAHDVTQNSRLQWKNESANCVSKQFIPDTHHLTAGKFRLLGPFAG